VGPAFWLNDLYGGKFQIAVSLGVISGVIGGSEVLSFLIPGAGPSRSGRWPRTRRSPPRRTETSCEASTRGSDGSLLMLAEYGDKAHEGGDVTIFCETQ
jgi:hypothetical protein